jgi:hypothetical protein
MKRLILPFAIVAALGLVTGCKESAQETAEDVAEARAETQENVAEEQRDVIEERAEVQQEVAQQNAQGDTEELNDELADGAKDIADEQYDVAIAAAKGRYDTALEQCDALEGDQKDACQDTAESTYQSEKASADADHERAVATSEDLDDMD